MTTGSLINDLYSRMTEGAPEPTVGMGATILMWTDRHAATVVAVEQFAKHGVIKVRRDYARVVSGSCADGSAVYEYARDPRRGQSSWFRRAKDGKWHEVTRNVDTGRWRKAGGNGLIVGKRDEYRDPHF